MIIRARLVAVLLLLACSRPFAQGPEARPGLGTTWGETRESRVHSVYFEREDPAQPSTVATIHYDDRRGVRAAAARPGWGDACWAGGALVVRVLDERGVAWPTFWRGPASYVEGRAGERYLLEVENRGFGRYEVVATVDGLDVMDGRSGSFDKRGYVLQPRSVLRIDGFRQSEESVAAFRFGSVAESYAAQTGDDRNVGVIGVAFFAERGAPPWSPSESARRRDADPFPGRFAEPPAPSW